MGDRGLYLGTGTDDGERLMLDMDHLTTHAVCLGMTGSGKTGLGVVALEELARRHVPRINACVLVLEPEKNRPMAEAFADLDEFAVKVPSRPLPVAGSSSIP